uniref:Zinc transporter ZIP10 n=1 Tax=Hydatigena taeniaeformis TaxID=6205 RepID=A0A0R3X292_HYDTA
LVVLLMVCSSKSHDSFDNQNLLMDPGVLLQKLFSKYERNGSICAHGLDKLIRNMRHPEKQCFAVKDMLNGTLNEGTFKEILPVLIYDLVENNCSLVLDDHHDHDRHDDLVPGQDWKVWGASIGAVVVINMSGLVVVVLIPLMSRKIFNVASQFLIALSVGSLIGDAFLHLIPHALLSDGTESHGHSHGTHDGDDNQHDALVWKSMIVILGIYAFFLTERLTIIYQNSAFTRKLKRKQKVASKPPTAPEEMSGPVVNGGASLTNQSSGSTPPTPHTPSTQLFVNLNQCPSSQAPRANIVGDIDASCGMTETSASRHLCNHPSSRPLHDVRCSEFLVDEKGTIANGLQGLAEISRTELLLSQQAHQPNMGVNNTAVALALGEGSGDPLTKQTKTDSDDDLGKTQSLDMSCHEDGHAHHEHGHHHHHHHPHGHGHHYRKPHGHHHGHSHDLSSVKAIAWTLLVGDGLHKLCDGIAIGASFEESLQGGLSTSLAVLCHELPHELGDFAILLHAGMSVKAALFYSTLSSIFCAAGMVLGVLLGSMPSVNRWLFLITGGMFVYLALVDMMPELATTRMSGHLHCHTPSVLFFWQNVGLIIGVATMLVIAKFEGVM